MSSMQNIYKDTQKATLPWQEVYTTAKSIVIDSRQRDCSRFKSPSYYTVKLDHTFKNINSVELKGASIPKSSYNIHSSNNKINFAIGGSVTGFKILDAGAGYTSAPFITITNPVSGITATATAVITSQGYINNIILTNPGSGYVPSVPPIVMISPPNNPRQAKYPRVIAIVGTHYVANLRVGEYEIGGNPNPPTTSLPTNLLLEIQNSMNYAVNGVYNPVSTSPFAARVVSQYPTLTATPGSPEFYDTNACLFNRIQIVNVNSDVWELLWYLGPDNINSAASVLGFNTVDTGVGTVISAVNNGAGDVIPAGTAIRGTFDYNLKDSPDYVILSISFDEKKMDRLKSPDDGLDDSFAVLLFDNNNPETLHDLSGSSFTSGGVKYLGGQTEKGNFWRDTGFIKPIKGQDFDQKKLSFSPPIASITNIAVKFTKFGYRQGGVPYFYNMEGREHLLMFEFTSTDNKSQMKD
jgi:hypothetical protein